jgi:hypothetical protein
MKMNKVVILIGKEKDTKSYQLVLANKYISISYRESNGDYNEFINNVTTDFAELISKQKFSLELGVLNGFRLDEEGVNKIEKLDSKLFESVLINKINKLSCWKNLVFPASNIN